MISITIPFGTGAPSGGGTFSVIATTYAVGISTGVTTSGINTTGSNLIVVVQSCYTGASTTPTLSDSNSNSWTLVRYDITGSSPQYQGTAIFYCYSPVVGSGHTFTANTYSSIGVVALSGAISSPLDQQNGLGSAGGATIIQPGSITPSINNEFVIFVLENYIDGSVPSTPTGYTLLGASAYSPGFYCFGMWYQIQTTATATNPSSNVSIEPFQPSSIASFKS